MGIYVWLWLCALLFGVVLTWMVDGLTHGGLGWMDRAGVCVASTAVL